MQIDKAAGLYVEEILKLPVSIITLQHFENRERDENVPSFGLLKMISFVVHHNHLFHREKVKEEDFWAVGWRRGYYLVHLSGEPERSG